MEERLSNKQISISCRKRKLVWGVYRRTKEYTWIFRKNVIQNAHSKLFLNGAFQLTANPFVWIREDNQFHTEQNEYFAIDWKYDCFLTKEKERACQFNTIDCNRGRLTFQKSDLRATIDTTNWKKQINLDFVQLRSILRTSNIGILLAAGTSSRFGSDTPKQLYRIQGIPICMKSLRVMCECLDKVLLVTNSQCAEKSRNFVGNQRKVVVVINDITPTKKINETNLCIISV